MSPDERLNRALSAPIAPAKDMHFALLVMQRAEADRFRAETVQRLLRSAALAGLAGAAVLALAGWTAENTEIALDATLAVAGMLGLAGLARMGRFARRPR